MLREKVYDHDLTNGGGRDAIAVLGLLEFLDGDELAAVGRWSLDFGKEDEAVGTFPDLPDKIVLLQPLRFVPVLAAVGACHASAVAVFNGFFHCSFKMKKKKRKKQQKRSDGFGMRNSGTQRQGKE